MQPLTSDFVLLSCEELGVKPELVGKLGEPPGGGSGVAGGWAASAPAAASTAQ